jgi:hypothetical protein
MKKSHREENDQRRMRRHGGDGHGQGRAHAHIANIPLPHNKKQQHDSEALLLHSTAPHKDFNDQDFIHAMDALHLNAGAYDLPTNLPTPPASSSCHTEIPPAIATATEGTEKDYDEPLLVDNMDLCRQVCEALQHERFLSIDLEGVDLGRDGTICILQIASRNAKTIRLSRPISPEPVPISLSTLSIEETETDGTRDPPSPTANPSTHTKVFLFDITTLQHQAFTEGLLKARILENRGIVKLFYDLRKDADALFHQYSVRVENVIDLQILHFEAFTRHSRGGMKQQQHSSGKGGRGKQEGTKNTSQNQGRGRGRGQSQEKSVEKGQTSQEDQSSSSATSSSTTNKGFTSMKRVTGFKKALEKLMIVKSTAMTTNPAAIVTTTVTTMASIEREAVITTKEGIEDSSTSLLSAEQLALSKEFQEIEEIKKRGLALFSPELGGSYSVWQTRPLHPDLITYCKNDVVKLFDMYDAWFEKVPLKTLHELSALRLQRTIDREIQWEGRDERWTLPDWL